MTVCKFRCTASACCIVEKKIHHSYLDAYKHSPVQFNTCFSLKLSPELIAFMHHLYVDIFLIGFPYNPGLAMRAPSGVGQNKLGRKKEFKEYCHNNPTGLALPLF